MLLRAENVDRWQERYIVSHAHHLRRRVLPPRTVVAASALVVHHTIDASRDREGIALLQRRWQKVVGYGLKGDGAQPSFNGGGPDRRAGARRRRGPRTTVLHRPAHANARRGAVDDDATASSRTEFQEPAAVSVVVDTKDTEGERGLAREQRVAQFILRVVSDDQRGRAEALFAQRVGVTTEIGRAHV